MTAFRYDNECDVTAFLSDNECDITAFLRGIWQLFDGFSATIFVL